MACLRLHRQSERLINHTASRRCDGFHTNHQQALKVTPIGQAGRGRFFNLSAPKSSRPLPSTLCHICTTTSLLALTYGIGPKLDTFWNIPFDPLKTSWRVKANLSSVGVVMVKQLWRHEAFVMSAHQWIAFSHVLEKKNAYMWIWGCQMCIIVSHHILAHFLAMPSLDCFECENKLAGTHPRSEVHTPCTGCQPMIGHKLTTQQLTNT